MGDRRQVWLGNIPLDGTEGMVIDHFRNARLLAPWKALVRLGKSQNNQFSIATFETEEHAIAVMRMKLHWWNGDHIVSRHAST
jgi:hypothetical protein